MSEDDEGGGVARRPVQNYLDMGFSPGDRVDFDGYPDEDIRIADGRRMTWNGRTVSLEEVRRQLGAHQGILAYYGRIEVAGRDLALAYDQTYGPRAANIRLETSGPTVTFADIVETPSMLMGVKAVWGKTREPVMCFGSRGDAMARDRGHFQQARLTAEKALEHPFLLTIGGGEQVTPDLRGRVLEVVRVSGAYGETAAFVHDPDLRERLAQWPVSVMLTEVYGLVGDPHLIDDLGFPDRRVLENAYDGVRSDNNAIADLWNALKDWPLEFRADVLPPPGFRDPGKAQLCSTLYPRISTSEGKRCYREATEVERSSAVANEAKRLNRERNGGVYVCEACDFSDEDRRLFDAHHLVPLSVGPRETQVCHLAILCPICHRWAHAKGPQVYEPLSVDDVRVARGF